MIKVVRLETVEVEEEAMDGDDEGIDGTGEDVEECTDVASASAPLNGRDETVGVIAVDSVMDGVEEFDFRGL